MSLAVDKNDPEVQELLIACMNSTRVFAKTFFPEEVESDFSILHDEIFRVIDDGTWKKKAIAAPRGLGKTTLAKIRACKAILFRETKFVVYLSNSATSAKEATEHIKRLLQSNELIKAFFGEVKAQSSGMKDSFAKDSWVAFGDVFVLPRGAGQQVRGLNWMGNRPGLIVIDDLESTESVQSDEQREKLSNWFFADLMKTESKYGDRAEFLYIDTVKHEIALLAQLLDASDWLSARLSICDDKLNTHDPNYMTTEEIKQEYANHKEAGKTDLFYMEYMNIPISLEDAVFKDEYFKYFTESGNQLFITSVLDSGKTKKEIIEAKDLITLVICDPAKTVKMQSDESASVVISVDRSSRKIFIRDIFSGKVKPDQLYDVMFEQVLRFKAMILAVEVTSLHEFISQPIESEMRVRGIYPQYIELNAKGKKDMRVATLAPLYRLGYIYHNKANCAPLENQLHWFPKSKLWDVMDATAYITKVMDENSIFFDPDGDFELPEEFDELEDDDLLKSDWRVA
jgi:hypothetical protein